MRSELYEKLINFIPKRFIVAVLCFFAAFNAFAMRVNVSVAIVAMVNHTHYSVPHSINNTEECPAIYGNKSASGHHFKGKLYNWDPSTQGYILSAFFYGYFISMFPGGLLARAIGPARLSGICMLLTSVFTLLTPVVLNWGLAPFLALRFFEGLGEGALMPSAMSLISRWAPKLERTRYTSFIGIGTSIGVVSAFIISGYLCSSDFLGGWPSVFYVFGTLGIVWYILWVIFIYESPYDHPNISKEELAKYSDFFNETDKSIKVPWKPILSSIPVWAVVATNIGEVFVSCIFVVEIPTYLSTILHFDIKSSGLLSSLPNMALAIGGFIAPIIADYLRSTDKLRVTTIRKIFNSISGYSTATCLVVVALSGCQSAMVVASLTIGMFLNGCILSGAVTSLLDMTPVFTGVLYGFISGISHLLYIIPPSMVGAIINNGATLANWRKVFYITAAIQYVATTVYAIFGSSDLQPWGNGEVSEIKEDKR